MRVEEGFQPVSYQQWLHDQRADPTFCLKQRPFMEGNAYTTDTVLPSLLKRLLPTDVHAEVDPDLSRFGGEVLPSTSFLPAFIKNPLSHA